VNLKGQRMKHKPVILVVDDQPQNIELLETYLAPEGYEAVINI
jgi:CheY-like chemotaxis protein